MSKSRVVLCRMGNDTSPAGYAQATATALHAWGPLTFVGKNHFVAIKLHVGEPGVRTFLPPEVAAVIAGAVKTQGGRPFLTDTAVLYASPRSNGPSHVQVALQHGFTLERTGAPFLPADGLEGNQEVRVDIPGKHFNNVGVAATIAQSRAMVVLSHATGHLAAGFGATLKNLGMGCSSRKGKLLQHSDTKPQVRSAKCERCDACVDQCPENAISRDGGGPALIDETRCIGCGECIAHCRYDAVGFRWDSAPAALQEKMVEHALGVVRSLKGNLLFVQGIVSLTKDCDCMAGRSEIVAKDIGFAVSSDPVALDQATLDLVREKEGKPLDKLAYPSIDGGVQLAYAERLGLGSRDYELVEA